MPAPLRLGTRGSALALAQAGQVARALTAATGRRVELVEVRTLGDTSRAALAELGGTGVFVSELRAAVADRRVDLAVHSLKDLPTAPDDRLVLAAVPGRADPRDVLVAREARRLAELPDGAVVGTGSPRRAAQLQAARPDLRIVPVRGNVDTRLGLVADGAVDGVVLARAGLLRLGRADEATDVLEPDVMLPAPGQGALAVEVGADRPDLVAEVAVLDDPAARLAVTAERALLAALEAGCSAPVGALAAVTEPGFHTPELQLEAVVAGDTGLTRGTALGPADDAVGVGRRLAERMLTPPNLDATSTTATTHEGAEVR